MCYVQATTFKSHLKSKSEGAQASGTGLNGLQPEDRSPPKVSSQTARFGAPSGRRRCGRRPPSTTGDTQMSISPCGARQQVERSVEHLRRTRRSNTEVASSILCRRRSAKKDIDLTSDAERPGARARD